MPDEPRYGLPPGACVSASEAPPSLTVPIVVREFAASIQKGLGYYNEGRVVAIRSDAHQAIGLVKGSRAAPYEAILRWRRSRGSWTIDSDCTCPVGAGCKHCAAVALAWVSESEAPAVARRKAFAAQAEITGAEDAIEAAEDAVDMMALPETSPLGDPWKALLADRHHDADDHRGSDSAYRDSADPQAPKLLFLFHVADEAIAELVVRPVVCKVLKSGRFGAPRAVPVGADDPQEFLRLVPTEQAGWLLAIDGECSLYDGEARWYPVDARFESVLESVLVSGRARWREPNGPILRPGDPRHLDVAWTLDEAGAQRLTPTVGAGARVVGESWSWYVEVAEARIGRVQSAWPSVRRRQLAHLPLLLPEHHASARKTLARLFPDLALPPFDPVTLAPGPAATLRATLQLDAHPAPRAEPGALPNGCAATLHFIYEGRRLPGDAWERQLRWRDGHTVRVVERDATYEREVVRFLHNEGFRADRFHGGPADRPTLRWVRPRALDKAEAAARWVKGFVDRARVHRIDVDATARFPHPVGADAGVPELAFEADTEGWFVARLGLEVDGERIDLLPVLLGLGYDGVMARIDGLRLVLPSGRGIRLSADRVGPMLDLLQDLERRGPGLGIRPEKLAGFQPPADWRFRPDARLSQFLERLRGFDGLAPLDPPSTFGATLRPYQRLGLAWLDFLREFGFGGVLADDMGLGKTVQCLAFFARERAEGRLQKPALVVCPTSVAPNWQAEATRWLPSFGVQMLVRGDRTAVLAELSRFDLVVTSYALLVRDIDVLRRVDWSVVVFDEAQWLKNAATKGYRAAAALRADLRLCMTGTPVENHLGELKAQLDLALPGLLGDDRRFARRFRQPIERERNATAEAALRARIRPFVLRRTKAAVATDLPPRSTLVQAVQFDTAQQDLYETLRAQMERRVRDALARRGVAQSTITVLDALLKLRQVCCDPSLVDLPSARKVKASAKREALANLLPTLIDEGRSVLLFSQFTGMLDLIERDLRAAGVGHVRLDGGTRDRAKPVERFQRGEVPVFLISLKAGGVGLNLTRADTVILYDPWWNPAVEAQAIDRAHRIGQDKPVFVYELQCVGTVEEKMAQLKQRKRAIADAVLSDGESAIGKLDAAALLALFEPTAEPGRSSAPKPSKGGRRQSH